MRRITQKRIITWERGELKFSIILRSLAYCGDFYCGYVTFPTSLLPEANYDGILSDTEVHGGLTYAEQNPDGSVTYGFDCAHSGDEHDSRLLDLDWLKQECERMADSIQAIVNEYKQKGDE